MCIGDRNPIHPHTLESCGPLQEEHALTCLIVIHDLSMRSGPGSNQGTFGLADECSTTELPLILWTIFFFFFFLFVCFTRYLVFRIAVLPHRPGVVYYHLLLRRETRIPGVAPFSFRIGIWDLFVHRGQKSYTPTAFGKLWTTPGVRCMKHASS